MQTIEEQYNDLWKFANSLQAIGIPLDDWYPPADSEKNSLLNKSFSATGVTPAALAMAKADKENHSGVRSLGAWNGINEEGGMAFITMIKEGVIPSNVDFSASEISELKNYPNVLKVTQAILEIWSPILVQCGPSAYKSKKVFQDRPGVGWMIYLPLSIKPEQVPEAEELIPIFGENKQQKGTLLISTKETFDINDKEHIKRANAIEIRLVDQDLLPKRMDFLKIR